jgi:predicted lactoylglutathione lyase
MVPSTIGFITLAVADIERSVAFYRDGLGWRTNGIEGHEFHDEATGANGTIAIFQLDGGLMLGLYERTNLALDAQVPSGSPNPTEFSLGISASTKEEVDQILAAVKAAGATMPAPAHMRPFRVYSGYFQDPDGHLWEVAWNADV